MKKNIFLILLFFLIALLVIYFTKIYSPQSNYDEASKKNLDSLHSDDIESTSIKDTSEVKLIEEYLVPVTNFKSIKSDYTWDEFMSKKLFTTDQNARLIPELLDVSIINLDNFKFEGEYEDVILILSWQEVKPWYKTINIDGNNIWSKEFDPDKWNLKKEIEVPEDEILFKDRVMTFFAGGEVIPARAVDRLGLNKYDNYTYLFDSFRKDIEGADISFALLENSLIGDPTPCTGCMSFAGDEKVLGGLEEVGFDFMSLAGNHAGDAGQKAMSNTVKLFQSSEKIQSTGVGTWAKLENIDQTKPNSPIMKEVNGINVGMISADDVAFYYWRSDESKEYATNHFSNRTENGQLVLDKEKIALLRDIKVENKIDYLIVYMSWGVEYTNKATKHQMELGHALIDYGADIIIGSHPHWVQNIEFYRERPIIYSLGNLIFDQTHTLPTRQGAAVNLHYLGAELKSIELMPHKICGYHQTRNDLSEKLILGELTIETLDSIEEKDGCVYWMPKKLQQEDESFTQILTRIFEFTEL